MKFDIKDERIDVDRISSLCLCAYVERVPFVLAMSSRTLERLQDEVELHACPSMLALVSSVDGTHIHFYSNLCGEKDFKIKIDDSLNFAIISFSEEEP